MTDTDHPYVFPPAPVTALPVRGSDARFPVRRIYCVGRNYAEHAREMGHDPDREPPFFFQKNPDDLFFGETRWPYPPATDDVHHEIELAMALSAGGQDIDPADVPAMVFGYAVALDMTRRDLQGIAKKAGRPWEVGKAFACSAPIGALVPATAIGHPAAGRIALSVNGQIRQEGDLAQMIWSPVEIVATLSRLFTLAPGDLILTGTPAGVGPVVRGDRLAGSVEGVGALEIEVV